MEIWDEKMQAECALSFGKEEVVKIMTQSNQIKLMNECINIITNATPEQEDVNNHIVIISIHHHHVMYLYLVYGKLGPCISRTSKIFALGAYKNSCN